MRVFVFQIDGPGKLKSCFLNMLNERRLKIMYSFRKLLNCT